MLDGRLIRVQLRDWNPTHRPFWKPGPNKETDSRSLGTSDDLSLNLKLPNPGIVNIAAHMADLQLTGTLAPPAPPSSGEASDLNEVQDEIGIPVSEVPPADDPECNPAKEVRGVEKSLDYKQGEPAPPESTFVSPQASTIPAAAVPGTYSAPTIQYYPGWIPNYTPQFPYQMPFAGQPYPGYPFPPPMVPPPTQNGGSDGNATPPYPPIPFGPVSGAYPVCSSHCVILVVR